jgi:hypothetical protein
MATEQEHFQACRRFQEYYDQVLSKVGSKAPAPSPGQAVNHYRRESLRTFKRTFFAQTHPLYPIQMRALPDDAIEPIETQVLAAVPVEAINPANYEPGEIRLVPWTDPQTGRKENRFYGQHSFVKDMMRPGRRVTGFRTPHGLELPRG